MVKSRSTDGDLERTGGGSQNLRWGYVPCIRPHNISRSTAIGCEAKYERSKKRSQGGFFSEIEAFCEEKGYICVYIRFQTTRDRQKTDIIEK